MVYTLRFFPSSKCSLFHNSNVFGSSIIHILYTGCAKIKKKNNIPAPKGYYKCTVHWSTFEVSGILVKVWCNLKALDRFSKITKFRENPPSESRVVPCGRKDGQTNKQTDRQTDTHTHTHDDANSRFFTIFAKAPKSHFLLLRDVTALCFSIKANHINTMDEQATKLFYVKHGGT